MKTRQAGIWDPTTNTEQILTIDDLEAQDWENLDAETLMANLPFGTMHDKVVRLLIGQLSRLTKKVKALENETIDEIILDPKA